MAESRFEFYCNHCGRYFPTSQGECGCGSVVNFQKGLAEMPDGHVWTPPGGEWCEACKKPNPTKLLLAVIQTGLSEVHARISHNDYQSDRSYTEWLEARAAHQDALRQLKKVL